MNTTPNTTEVRFLPPLEYFQQKLNYQKAKVREYGYPVPKYYNSRFNAMRLRSEYLWDKAPRETLESDQD